MKFIISGYNTTTYEDASEDMYVILSPVKKKQTYDSIAEIAMEPQKSIQLRVEDDTKTFIRENIGKTVQFTLKVVGE